LGAILRHQQFARNGLILKFFKPIPGGILDAMVGSAIGPPWSEPAG
jgi:hypothetical protein